MKRLLLLLLGIFACVSAHAEVGFYKADSFAYKYTEDNGRWNEWSDWNNSEILISIDYTKEKITVYSEMEQRYIIIKDNGEYSDKNGGKQKEFTVVDQDGDVGVIRVRIQKNGVAQLYVEFDNIMWVYSGLKAI